MIVHFFKKNKKRNFTVDPDEIFLDSKNIGNFDLQQFEGRIEKPISRKTVTILGVFFMLIGIVFIGKLTQLQIYQGEKYKTRSENNTLDKINIFAERGIIYDRNDKELVWNTKMDQEDFYFRSYLASGFSHLLGYVDYPKKDNKGKYWTNEFTGKDGLEKIYNDKLQGENGSKLIETDAQGTIYSENIVNAPKRGLDLKTTIDSRIQKQFYTSIKNFSEAHSFTGGAGIMMDLSNGEVLALTNFPEYDSEILSLGKDKEIINKYINDKRKYFLNRSISGLYTPGSIVKPIFALAALKEKIIDPFKQILSTGSISIPNPYFPELKSIFKDWKAHGYTDMREALAVSSDVYFYEIGGGYEDQKGLGIKNLEKYSLMFGLEEKTNIDLPNEKSGIVPSQEWKAKFFKNDIWRVGDTYNTSIGQYGFQVTPIEMARAVSAIGNKGHLPTPNLLLEDEARKSQKVFITDLPEEYYKVVHEGMRQAVVSGTASALNLPFVKVAGKTGTAQVGISKNKINSWIVGFFPYENPKYSFVVLMESGPSGIGGSATLVMKEVLDWMFLNTPEYFE